MKNIIIVTNEANVVDSTLKHVYNEVGFVKIENVPATAGDAYAKWVEVIDDVETETMAVPLESNEYNILRIPVAGLAYMIAYARKHDLTEDNNMVVCMKELYPTMIYSLEKYHLYMYGGRKVGTGAFREFFSLPSPTNSLLTEQFDDIYEMIYDGKIAHMSSYTEALL